MKIFNVIGLTLFLFMLLILMPAVFTGLTRALVTFLDSTEKAFQAAGVLASYAEII